MPDNEFVVDVEVNAPLTLKCPVVDSDLSANGVAALRLEWSFSRDGVPTRASNRSRILVSVME